MNKAVFSYFNCKKKIQWCGNQYSETWFVHFWRDHFNCM